MNEQLAQTYIASNDIFGLPQIYKGIEFHPIQIKASQYLTLFYNLFTYPKNFVSDKEVIKMSYLRFMIAMSKDREKIITDISKFFKYVCRKDKVDVITTTVDASQPLSLENSMVLVIIDGVAITEWEFEELREIILEQNGMTIEYINQYHPQLEEKLHQLQRRSDINFEDQIFTMAVLMKKNPSEIGDYTIYQLQNVFDRMTTLKQFDLYQPLVATGQVTLKGGGEIKPYLYHRGRDRGRYDDILIASSKFFEQNKEVLNQ